MTALASARSRKRTHSVLVAIVGGSGSGKTWLAQRLARALAPHATLLSQDSFYRDRSHLPVSRRAQINFDHPRAIDWPALLLALRSLAFGCPAYIPGYDFSAHSRLPKLQRVFPKPIVLVEGLWLLRRPDIRRLFALSIYLRCPAHLRLQRRLARDCHSRGRTPASIKLQFRRTVGPMHRKYVAPQAVHADIVVKACGSLHVRQVADFIRLLKPTNSMN